MQQSRRASRGMTLVELMVVVAIIGVLAVLASVGYGRWIASAKMAEATNMVASIKNGQENYYSQAGHYLDLSKSVNPPDLYPAKDPGPTKVAWGAECTWCKADWKRLGVKADAPVYFGYATVADDAADPSGRGITVTTIKGTVNWTAEAGGAINKPWYIVVAQADTNGNKKYAKVVGFSFGGRIITDNEGE
jgi:type IV pilus assembly protein PilA